MYRTARLPKFGLNTATWAVLYPYLAISGAMLLFVQGMTPSFSADDYPHLLKNIHYENFWQALSVFSEMDGREYRPLVRLSLWLNYQMDHTAIAFHYTNLLLHFACTLCLYLICRQLCGARLPATAASLAFTLHPIHTTNVFFIMGRTDIVCAVFYLSTVLFFVLYLRHQKSIYWGLAFACLFLSLLSKEMAASAPLVLFAISLLLSKHDWRKRIFTALRHTVAFFALLVLYMLIRIYFWSTNPDSISEYVNYSVVSSIRNLVMWSAGLAYPSDLYQLRYLLETNPPRLVIAAVSYISLCLIALALVVGKPFNRLFKDRLFVLCIAWFVLTLAPIIGGGAHRWYLYIPSASVSFFILALWRSTKRRRLFIVCLCLFGFFSAIEVWRQSNNWRQQSVVSENFLQEIEAQQLQKQKSYYFANVPLGYKSTFLFTFHSLEDAIFLRWGFRPEISVLSYLNLADATSPLAKSEGNSLEVTMKPDKYSFFLFPLTQRRFPAPGETFRIANAVVTIDLLTASGTVSGYSIDVSRHNDRPIYYFDGTMISRVY